LEFTEFGLDDQLMQGIEAMGYKTATPVQEQVIPAFLAGKDVIAAAQTGTGKTAAFLLPLMQQLITHPHDTHKINAIVIVPTRELALQINQSLDGLSYFTGISSIAVYGGGGGELFAAEKKALTKGVDIVICTPGRMISHLNMGYIKCDGLRYIILDEADRMLDMGFVDDIVKIISFLPKERQALMFSATMPPEIRKLAHTILRNPLEVNIAISKPPEQIDQSVYHVFENQKLKLLSTILTSRNLESILIFCGSKQGVKDLHQTLRKAGFPIGQIQSDLEQQQREQVLLDFKNKKLKILVATNIISRGIHIDDISLVLNYDVPQDAEEYVHRVGRTARAATTGAAITFVSDQDKHRFDRIEKLLGYAVRIEPLPEELGPGPDMTQNTKRSPGKKKYKKFK